MVTATQRIHRVNAKITAKVVRLISQEGKQVGVVPLEEAYSYAQSHQLDLVEVEPKAAPPVCRVLDYGKFRYAASKKRHEAKRKQKNTVTKEIKFRPSTDVGDYDVKLNRLRKFLTKGNKTKVTLRFRGREMSHPLLGLEVLQRVERDLAHIAFVEQQPSMEGRQMVMMLAPIKS